MQDIPILIPSALFNAWSATEQQQREAFDAVPLRSFFHAWYFLANHPMVFDGEGNSLFSECLDIFVHKSADSETEIWLEFGNWCEIPKRDWIPSFDGPSHDIRLDTAETTFERSIVVLTQKVEVYYGNYIPDLSAPEREAPESREFLETLLLAYYVDSQNLAGKEFSCDKEVQMTAAKAMSLEETRRMRTVFHA